MCDHLLNGGPLVCDRTDPHDAAADCGHTYTSTKPDEHADGGADQ
jgi:hypothetical protein